MGLGAVQPLPMFLSIRYILGGIKLWVGDPSTSSCRVSPVYQFHHHERIK